VLITHCFVLAGLGVNAAFSQVVPALEKQSNLRTTRAAAAWCKI
jgi:hypothetical protein